MSAWLSVGLCQSLPYLGGSSLAHILFLLVEAHEQLGRHFRAIIRTQLERLLEQFTCLEG